MYRSLVLGLAGLASLAVGQLNADITGNISTATTTTGIVFTSNITSNGISVFKGIPYAQPPIDDLRWRAPRPVAPWAHRLNATSTTVGCWEFAGANSTDTVSEDCLYLNVWTPAKYASEGLAVMFWIHGGGFNALSGIAPLEEGVHLAARDVVVVSINYRLGNFGFLAHSGLDAEDPVGNSGNFGLQDMIEALRWVKGNIRAFGGNPDNIMVFGESAGGHAVPLLMASPLSEGLFAKAMCSSGAWWDSEHGNMESFNQSRQRGERWANSVVGAGATLESLRAIPAWVVQNTSFWAQLDPGTTAFSANIDHYVIPELVPKVFAEGRQMKVPMLAGHNAREDTYFQQRAINYTSSRIFNGKLFSFLNQTSLSEDVIRDGMGRYYPATNTTNAQISSFLWTADLVIAEQTWEALHLHQKMTHQPSWLYFFNFTSDFSPIAGHGTDLPYIFGTLKPFGTATHGLPTASDRSMSSYMLTYYTNFAKTSNPNKPDNLNGTLPVWPAYEACEGKSICSRGTCGPKQRCTFELRDPPQKQEHDFSRFEFIQSWRSNGAFPAGWHEFVANDGFPLSL
ncbi:alpha/beta-hydrolase [Xylariaceae sp. FL1019]|nr:alpha/beta-hydrolase [Xylariaceae sp. FL1019]